MKRIHELAKEHGVHADAIIDFLKRAGLPASKCTSSSTISEDWERRLGPVLTRIRDAEKKQLEKERQAAATASHAKAKSQKLPAIPVAHAPGGAKAGGAGASATGLGKAGAGKSAAVPAAHGHGHGHAHGKKPAVPQPKRWTDEVSEAPAAAAHELDAWVEAGPKERKPSRKEQQKAKHRDKPPTVNISGEDVSVLDDIPAAPGMPGVRHLTAEEIVRAAGLEMPPAPPPEEELAAEVEDEVEAQVEVEAHVEVEVEVAPPPPPPPPPAPVPVLPPVVVREAPAPAPVPVPVPVAVSVPVPAPAAPLAPPAKTEAELRKERREERARLERDRDEYLRVEKERVERERAARDRAAREVQEKERAEREKVERERTARETQERDRAERERTRRETQLKEKEISPAAAALTAALAAKKRQEAAAARQARAIAGIEEVGADEGEEAPAMGEDLLGEIPEEDEVIDAAVGAVPEGPTKKGPVPITRKDKRPNAPAASGPGQSVKTGFQQGRGFAVGRGGGGGYPVAQGRGGQGGGAAPAAGRGGDRSGRQFFKIGGGGGGGGMYGRGSQAAPQKFERPTKVTITPPFTVKELSTALGVKIPEIMGKMLRKGKVFTLNTPLSEELALEIGLEFNVEVEVAKKHEAEDELAKIMEVKSEAGALSARAPVITILGHVDHGKTSLLDRIRSANVAAGEAGGITQHIGAYKVALGADKSVVFVDTPGHEAFTEMRARGANVTDVVVLVVAADDGVMPQTEEAYNHAKAAGVPVVVALNKIDKNNANPMRVKQQLATLGLQPVEWGGSTEVIEVSALTGKGIDTLLETLALQSEILELKANPDRPAVGTCLEARISEGRGIVASLLVQEGTLKRGDVIICGAGYGRARALFDDKGRQLQEAPPATPVEVIGLEEIPEAGARFYVLDDLAKAKDIAGERMQRKRQAALAERTHVTLDNIFERMKAGKAKEVRIVLKADVKGSIEVLSKEIPALSTDEVKVKLLHSGVGAITEADVQLADASDAIVIGFSVVADEKARTTAEQKGVDIRTYRIIYQITDDIKKAMEGLLAPELKEVITSQIEVRKIFHASQIGTIAGCMVKSGKVERTNKARLIRDGVIKFEGDMAGLRRMKDDAKEVREGFECGITLKNYNDINEGDRIETYMVEKIARTLA